MDFSNLPDPFNRYWKMPKPLPKKTVSKKKENVSEQWQLFLRSVQQQVDKDLKNS